MSDPFVNIHTHRRTGEGIEIVSAQALSGALPAAPFSVGIHPWQLGRFDGTGRNDADRSDGIDLELALREVEQAPACAIGEIGLDFAPGKPDHGEQKMVFAAQLRISEERRLPVILHCVKAFEQTMEILSAYRPRAVIFHGFVGSREQAIRATNSGYYLSIGERSLASPKTLEALRSVPSEKLFAETDDAPVPVAEIYSRIAKIIAIPREELARQIYSNYRTIFE